MELEIESQTGAAYGKRNPERLAKHNGYRDRTGRPAPARLSCAFPSCARAPVPELLEPRRMAEKALTGVVQAYAGSGPAGWTIWSRRCPLLHPFGCTLECGLAPLCPERAGSLHRGTTCFEGGAWLQGVSRSPRVSSVRYVLHLPENQLQSGYWSVKAAAPDTASGILANFPSSMESTFGEKLSAMLSSANVLKQSGRVVPKPAFGDAVMALSTRHIWRSMMTSRS